MKILITGASGLIGSALRKSFGEKQYDVLIAKRGTPTNPSEVEWDVETGFRNPDQLEGLDAVINLAGFKCGNLNS